MASFDVDFSDDYMGKLLQTDFDDIAQEALTEVSPILVESTRKAVKEAVKHTGDSELANSIKAKKPKKIKDGSGWIVDVVPTGNSSEQHTYTANKNSVTKRKCPVTNVLKAIWLEYGIAGRQPAHPFLAKATNSAKESSIKAIQDIYKTKVGAE